MTISDNAAIGAVVASLVASLIAFLGLIISKENKTSEFRQGWIDELRNDIALLTGSLLAVRATLRIVGNGPAAWDRERENLIQANCALARIRLRLRPDEAATDEIRTTLDDIEGLYSPSAVFDYHRAKVLEKRLLESGQSFLKKEWNRVRDGEKVFRVAKWTFVGLAILSAGAVVVVIGQVLGAN